MEEGRAHAPNTRRPQPHCQSQRSRLWPRGRSSRRSSLGQSSRTARRTPKGSPDERTHDRHVIARPRRPRRQENPRLARAGLANPGFYAESGDYHSVRELTPEVNAKHGQSAGACNATDPPSVLLAAECRQWSHKCRQAPPLSPKNPSTGQGQGCQRHVAVGEAGTTCLLSPVSPRCL